ncbi:hypothetical protein PVL30_003422 [Lodderomyces elongisporus]|uniref:uncharacterized protein n=1 Tax=Lodderomyces elongisporus TaxID=36914 RepID=UPI0029231D37|nr:uncharacterized protein PVL30_003422 [Lodderomyces elongisporus]WLF79665.1 hypothetical protein PVL30_003422 [Lodderomyces elongisporus]
MAKRRVIDSEDEDSSLSVQEEEDLAPKEIYLESEDGGEEDNEEEDEEEEEEEEEEEDEAEEEEAEEGDDDFDLDEVDQNDSEFGAESGTENFGIGDAVDYDEDSDENDGGNRGVRGGSLSEGTKTKQNIKDKQPSRSIKITIKPPKQNPKEEIAQSSAQSVPTHDEGKRQTRKRQVNYYQDETDDFEEKYIEEKPASKPKRAKVVATRASKPVQSQRRDIDPELLLTDEEEEEYNPGGIDDITKLTERQRARLTAEESGTPLFELDESGKKPKSKTEKEEETEEEVALRKAENARKRLDYKNKVLEEEKRDTLNKLLKRRATKSREIIKDDNGEGTQEEELSMFRKNRRPMLEHPALIRYVNNTTTLQGNSIIAYK